MNFYGAHDRTTVPSYGGLSGSGCIVANPEVTPITGGASMHNEVPEKRDSR